LKANYVFSNYLHEFRKTKNLWGGRNYAFFSTLAQKLLVGQVVLIIEESRWHSETQHSVELFWTSDHLQKNFSLRLAMKLSSPYVRVTFSLQETIRRKRGKIKSKNQ